jgi:hypothetical protein
MSTINRLSSVDALQPGDLIPVWDGSNGDTRKASLTTLLAFIESNFADPDYSTRIVAPNTDYFTVDIGNTGDSIWMIVNPVLNFTTGTITLPSTAYAVNDQEITVVFTAAVVNFSITSSGATVLGAPATINGYDSFRVRYNASQQTWYTLDTTGDGAGGVSQITRQDFTGDGTTTTFTLTTAPSALGNELQIFIDGVYQERSGYVVTGSNIVFSEAPPSLSTIEVLGWSITIGAETSANLVSYTPAGTGAVVTTVQAKLRKSVSVLDFGAVGDGVADDTAAINLAYAAAASLRARLYVPSGVYKITSGLRWIGEVPVYGDGGGQGTLSGTQFLKVGNFTAIFISSSEGIEYCGFSVVQSGGPAGGGGGKGVDIYWGNRMRFHDIWIEGHSFYGLHVRAGNVASYKDVNISNCGDDGVRWDSGTGWGAGSNEVGEGSPGAQTAQGCYVENFDIRSCNSITAGAAFNIQIGRQNIYQSLILQNNSDKGIEVNTEGNIITYYSESNGASELFTASSQGNFITITLTGGYTDSGAANSIFDYNQAGQAAFGWTKCFINKGLFQDQDFAVASSPWQIYETGNASVHELTIMDAGSAAKQGTVRIKHNAGTTANLAVEGSVSVKRVLSNDNVFALDDTGTPDVSDSNLYLTGGTTNITDFDNGILGQTLKIRANHSVTIVHSATVNLSGSVNYAMTPGDTLVLTMYEDQIWNEDSRAVL